MGAESVAADTAREGARAAGPVASDKCRRYVPGAVFSPAFFHPAMPAGKCRTFV